MTTSKHNLVAFLISFAALALYMLVNLQNYNTSYNIRYVMDLYAHSQWSIKDAVRSIGDDGLYQAAAYHILTTGKIAEINPEAPPAGKYLISLSILFFNNPYYVHPILYLLCAILVFKIAFKLSSPRYAWIALTLFLSEPLIGLQSSGTLLDLPQLFWLLLHIFLLQKFIEPDQEKPKSTIKYGLGLGITLGLFAATKFGIFTLIIFLCDIWILVLAKKISSLPVIIATSLLTYATVFVPYLIQHQGDMSAWLALEKHRLSFYRQSLSVYIPGAGIVSMLTPWHFSWWDTAPQLIHEWNLLWPFSTLIIFIAAWINKKDILSTTRQKFTGVFQKAQPQQTWYQTTPTETPTSQLFGNYLTVLAAVILITTSLIPFWPRYLTNILPLGMILFAYLLHQQKLPLFRASKVIIPLAIIVGVLHIATLAYIVTPSASETAKTYATWFSKSLYLDIYHALASSKGLDRTDEEFWKQLLKLENDMRLYQKSTQIIMHDSITLPWDTVKQATLITTYETPLGPYKHESPLTLRRNFNRWEIEWQWKYILSDYHPTDTVSLTLDTNNSCEVHTQDNRIAAQFKQWPVLYMIPHNLYTHPNKEQLYIEIFYLTGISPLEIESHYRANSPDDAYTRLAQLGMEYSDIKLEELVQRSGFQARDEIVWVISKNLSEQQRKDAQAITDKYNLHQSPVNGTLVRKRRGEPDEILLERNEIGVQCLYTI